MKTIHLTILLLVCLVSPAVPQTTTPEEPKQPRTQGVMLHLYEIGDPMGKLGKLIEGQTPNISKVIPKIDLRGDKDDFGAQDDFFYSEVSGFLRIEVPGLYSFQLVSDDGSQLLINGKVVVDHDGVHGAEKKSASVELQKGDHPILVKYFEEEGGERLSLSWKKPGDTDFKIIPPEVLSCGADEVHVTSPGKKKMEGISSRIPSRPGDGKPLAGVHPSFNLVNLRPDGFEPKVGGMDFLSDGRLVVCTWDSIGAVYVLDGVLGESPREISVKRFASGLAEPLGLCVVNDEIHVLQKQELTRLLDHDRDGVADEYQSISNLWNVTANFHEFAFGLLHKDGSFYAALAVAINPGGRTTQPQAEGRGTVIRIGMDGSCQTLAAGIRTPNGIGWGPDGEIFVADNQGDWLPSSKIVHVKEGSYFGSHITPRNALAAKGETPPALWLPQNEIGNSPSQLILVKNGIYAGQMLHGDVTHGGLKRDFIERINDEYQGCVFRFSQGLEAGVNRVCWGPDGALYVGGIGSTGNWGQKKKSRFGLQKLVPNGMIAFEMLAVRARTNGFEIEFTEPVAAESGRATGHYHVKRWKYAPTSKYGGPKIDEKVVNVRSATCSKDRRKVLVQLEDYEPGHIYHVRLLQPFVSAVKQSLWSTEAWYTLNAIPENSFSDIAPVPPNTLTSAERAQGWELLFDGHSTAGWRGFRSDTMPGGWQAIDGTLARVEKAGDIVTESQFDDFELRLEWKISEGGNSGIFYRVSGEGSHVWETGPEMQVLDNQKHRDGQSSLTSAGSAYGLAAPEKDVTFPPGSWNEARILVKGNHVEHWLNGEKLLEYELDGPKWLDLVSKSKFSKFPAYGRMTKGHIALQDHGDSVAYRNIKIRRLDPP